ASFGDWYATAGGRYDSRKLDYSFDILDPFARSVPIALDPRRNPFDSSLSALVPRSTVVGSSQTTRSEGQANIGGPLFTLPTGEVRLRVGVIAGRSEIALSDGTPFSRTDATME